MAYAIIIPACNEEECIRTVLAELGAVLDFSQFIVAVGVNGSSDRTARLAREHGVMVAETSQRGYGYGCQVAIDAVLACGKPVEGLIFLAADGANDPRDIAQLVQQHKEGCDLVLGTRTTLRENLAAISLQHALANRILGLWCWVLTGKFSSDLGPLRLIDLALWHKLRLCEWTYGWTIEAQIKAARLEARICEVPVQERSRLAGEQKVSGVSWRRTFAIGRQIFAAGWRARWAALPENLSWKG
jgi:glycosyltransferase involved in cell wall biosynthesis